MSNVTARPEQNVQAIFVAASNDNLHAIAARETDNSCSPGHPCPTVSAATSTVALTRLAGDRITCLRTGQSYERVTAICHNTSGVEINCAMVDSGAAVLWEKFNRQRPICRI